MANVKVPYLKFRPSASEDVVAHRIREVADYAAPFVTVTKASDPDGFVRVAATSISFLEGHEDGDVALYVTAADEVGNESDFLEVRGPLDLVAPAAPTAGELS